MRTIKRLFCRLFGHKWKSYPYTDSNGWEEAYELCDRCGLS